MSAVNNLLIQLIGLLAALYGSFLAFGGVGLLIAGVGAFIVGGVLEFAEQPKVKIKKEVSS